MKEPVKNLVVKPEDSFLLTEIGLCKIKELEISVENTTITHQYKVVSDISKAIFKDVFSNTSAYLNHDGSIAPIEFKRQDAINNHI